MTEQKTEGTNRKLVMWTLAIIIFGGVWYFTRINQVVAPINSPDVGQSLIAGEIAFAEGAVEYKRDGTWTRAEQGTALKEGDAIEVVGVGKAIINLDDGSAIRLNANSAVTLASLAPSNFIIANNKGQVYTRVAKSDRVFEVKVDDVNYRSVGTAYKTINEEKIKGVEVYESKVKVLGVTNTELLVEQGNKYYVVNKDNKKIEKTLVKITQTEVDKDEFLKWNKAQDSAAAVSNENKTTASETNESASETSAVKDDLKIEDEVVVQKPAEISGIILTGKQVSGGIYLSWKVTGLETPNGFKVVKSAEKNPVYPGNDYQYLSDSNVRSYKWALNTGSSYYFRVCQYVDGKCMAYSNNVYVKAPVVEIPTEDTASTDAVRSLSLVSVGESKVTWKINGYSKNGFKLVYSQNSSPTYPTRDGDKYQYFSEPETRSANLDAFEGEGEYYVRVCEYLGGKCGVYSNQIKVSL